MQKLLIIILSVVLVSCNDEYQINGSTMGTTYQIKSNILLDKKIIENRLQQINSIFSNWDKNSAVEILNQDRENIPLKTNLELLSLIKISQDIYQKTDGYFDIGIGYLIDIWGFGVQKIKHNPSTTTIAQILQNSSIKYLKIIDEKIIKTKSLKLNLSAIAKGYGVDEIIKILQKQGVTSGLVEIGGEVRVIGKKNIGIERLGKSPLKVVLKNQAIATSGDYRNYRIFNDKKFIHILNPKTGYPATSDLISVSVIHKNTAIADGFATALLAMGKKNSLQIIKKYNLNAVLIDKNNKIDRFFKD